MRKHAGQSTQPGRNKKPCGLLSIMHHVLCNLWAFALASLLWLNAGADGMVCTWAVTGGTLSSDSLQSSLHLEPPYGSASKLPVVRALCVSPHDKDIMIGTSACDIWEVHESKQVRKNHGLRT